MVKTFNLKNFFCEQHDDFYLLSNLSRFQGVALMVDIAAELTLICADMAEILLEFLIIC